MLKKVVSGSKPFGDQFGSFHFETGQFRPQRVFYLPPTFPLWTMLEKVGSGSKPRFYRFATYRFHIMFYRLSYTISANSIGFNLKPFWSLFKMKGSKSVPKGFGTCPLLFRFGPCWKKWGQVPNPVGPILVPFKMKGAKSVPKGFGTCPLLFHFGPC